MAHVLPVYNNKGRNEYMLRVMANLVGEMKSNDEDVLKDSESNSESLNIVTNEWTNERINNFIWESDLAWVA